MPKQNKNAPVPAVFARKSDPCDMRAIPWTITDETPTGLTALNIREMRVPMDDAPESMGVRQHEMLHVALSPITADQLDMATLAAEDGRIESLATFKGIKRNKVLDRDQIRETVDGSLSDPFNAACIAVAVVGSPQERIARTALKNKGRDDLLALMDAAGAAYREDESFTSTERVAGMIRDYAEPPPPNGGDGQDGEPQEGKPQDGDGEPQDGDGEGQEGKGDIGPPKPAQAPTEPRKPPRKPKPGSGKGFMAHAPRPSPVRAPSASRAPRKRIPESKEGNRKDGIKPVDVAEYAKNAPKEFGYADTEDARWAEPRIETPARTVRLEKHKGRGKGKASDMGVVPRRMGRMTVDQKVFSSSRHRPRGTVLLDLSGSTSYLREITEDVIRAIPAAIVAGYWGESGSSYDDGDTARGVIRILAANGKMVGPEDMTPTGSANEIDGPAVAWLAAQQSPRIWLFDGGATTAGDRYIGDPDDNPNNPFWREINAHVYAGRIKIIDPNQIANECQESGKDQTEELVNAVIKVMR